MTDSDGIQPIDTNVTKNIPMVLQLRNKDTNQATSTGTGLISLNNLISFPKNYNLCDKKLSIFNHHQQLFQICR